MFILAELSFAQQDSPVYSLEGEVIDSSKMEGSKKNQIWQNLKYDATNVAGGFLNAYAQPTRWEKDDYYKLGATATGIVLLYLGDEETSDFFRKNEQDVPQAIRDFGWYFGSPQNNYGLTSAIYLTGLFTNNEELRETGVLMIASASAAGLIQQVSKSLTGRTRPTAEMGKNHFKPFGGSSEYRSFPSGHTVLSVTTMYALSKQFESPWLKGGCYVIGAIPPVSRLLAGAHWLTDIMLSTVMSIAIVEGVDSYLERNNKYKYDKAQSNRKISWRLVAGPTQFGIIGAF